MKLIRKIAIGTVLLALIFAFFSYKGTTVSARVEEVPVKTLGIRYSTTFNKEVIQEVFGKHAKEAIAIANCESSLDNRVKGDLFFSVGLFQIYTKVHTQYSVEQLTDPLYNTQVAYKIFQEKGWQPWSCAKRLGLL